MSRKKNSSTVKIKSEDFPLDKYIRLKFKKFELTKKQKQLLEIAFNRDTSIVFIHGPAGTAKTFTSVYAALQLFNMDQEKEILYVRTSAESGDRSLGFLPGSVDEKIGAFGMPLFDKLEKILNKDQSLELIDKNIVKIIPINYTRGGDWSDKIIIADEVQNYSQKELITLLTRIGENSKYFLCGDFMQSDIGNKSAIKKVTKLFDTEVAKSKGIHTFQFDIEDIMRSEILKFIIGELEKLN